MTLAEAIDDYLGEWLAGAPPLNASKEWYRQNLLAPHAILETTKMRNWISQRGNRSLNLGATLLLEQMGEQRRVSNSSARRALVDAHVEHLPKAMRTGLLSEHAVIARAMKKIAKLERHDGSYVVPMIFAHGAKNSDYRFGCVRIVSRSVFEKFSAKAVRDSKKVGDFNKRMAPHWKAYAKSYDHFLIVDISGHELKMAEKVARQVAEVVLNAIRMAFGFNHTSNIRLGDGFVWEARRSRIRFDSQGAAHFSFSSGPWGSILDDKWIQQFETTLGNNTGLMASLTNWMVSNIFPSSPILERLNFANALIAEAYGEPHDHIRLVRLVAALETLAVLPREEKAHGLALRCAKVGGWHDYRESNKIYDVILEAYRLRSAIVHGDAPRNEAVMGAFYRLEDKLGLIYLGFISIFAEIQNERPAHIQPLRRAVAKRLGMFVYGPAKP